MPYWTLETYSGVGERCWEWGVRGHLRIMLLSWIDRNSAEVTRGSCITSRKHLPLLPHHILCKCLIWKVLYDLQNHIPKLDWLVISSMTSLHYDKIIEWWPSVLPSSSELHFFVDAIVPDFLWVCVCMCVHVCASHWSSHVWKCVFFFMHGSFTCFFPAWTLKLTAYVQIPLLPYTLYHTHFAR